MKNTGPFEQQQDYLKQRAEQFASFAKSQHRRQGRGIVVIGWPAPNFPKLEDILDSTHYLPEGELALVGFDVGDEVSQAVREYDPTKQAIIMCIEALRRSFSVHVLTAIYGYATPPRYTSH